MQKVDLNLTVFIPTFNRVNKLNRTINYFLQQINYYKFNILIGDNNSTDDTVKYLEILSNKHKFINYYRNEKNIGITLNIFNGIKNISTDWVWIFGDDDIFHPSVFEIFNSNKNCIEGVIFKSSNFRNFEASVFEKSVNKEIKPLKVNKSNIKEVNMAFGFISSNIFKTVKLSSIYYQIMQFSKLQTNNFTPKLASALYQKNYGLHISKQNLIYQDISEGSYFSKNINSNYKTFVIDELEILEQLILYNVDYLPIYKKNLYKRMLRPFFFAKAYGDKKGNKGQKQLTVTYHLPFTYQLISFSPKFLLRISLFIYKRLKNN